ncbi:Zinc-responsive transcriptional regulator ZAP1 [Orchesella cincta]|uniref:Zinc-responsive transcriptional regulator ZAP1 n=1 Tax=Orchesella cincta TaxID=48709 RepID=A0A1D2MBJ1_ORCCI|nr:Zinc-responsive transcriptional regulator ZAP1 [Orchesella cincta]
MIFSGSRMSGSGRKGPGNRESSAPSSSFGKTSCLMCHTPVYINLTGSSTAAEAEERRKMVKALCDFRQFTLAIPDNCSETNFPFCVVCKERLERFSKEWDALQTTFVEIEGSVADGEIQRSGYRSGMLPVDKELEKQKCSVLADMILEGYRVKLLERSKKQFASAMSSTALTNGVPNHDFRRAICPATSTTAGQSSCDLDESQIEDSVAIPISASQVGETWRMETDCGPALSITNIRTVELDQNSDGMGRVVVKQEPSPQKDENEEERRTTKDTKLASPHRRLWCGGIEIYRMPPPDSGSKLPKRFQCSRCSFNLLAKRGAKGGNVETPLQKMRAHVRAVHLRRVTANTRAETESDYYRKRPGRPKKVQPTVTARIGRPRARRTFKCFVCGRLFSKEVLLESHLSRHEADNPKPARTDDGEFPVSAEIGIVNAQVGNPKYIMELVDV